MIVHARVRANSHAILKNDVVALTIKKEVLCMDSHITPFEIFA